MLKNTRGVLPTCQEKFGHVGCNRLWSNRIIISSRVKSVFENLFRKNHFCSLVYYEIKRTEAVTSSVWKLCVGPHITESHNAVSVASDERGFVQIFWNFSNFFAGANAFERLQRSCCVSQEVVLVVTSRGLCCKSTKELPMINSPV